MNTTCREIRVKKEMPLRRKRQRDAYHTSSVIAKRIPARVHQPVIRVTDALLVQPVKRVPGFTHVAQHHVRTLVGMIHGSTSHQRRLVTLAV